MRRREQIARELERDLLRQRIWFEERRRRIADAEQVAQVFLHDPQEGIEL